MAPRVGYRMRVEFEAGTLLLALLDGVAVLARHDLDLRRGDDLVRLHLELRVLHDERPHVVAQAVRVQVALVHADATSESEDEGKVP